MFKHKLSGVIFDLDNTLVTSSIDFTQIRSSLGCPKEVDILDHVASLPIELQPQANKMIIEHEMQDAHSAKKFGGTDQLLALLADLAIPCAIVTRNCRQAAAIKVDNNGIDIPLLLTREDHKAKPAPDALLYLAEHWQKPPEHLLYVGDYLYDIQAAINANTMSCLVTYGKTLDYEYLANLVVKDLNELHQTICLAFK
ncbi:MAG: HAD-IA family hydrolase [Psychromonas sp.]